MSELTPFWEIDVWDEEGTYTDAQIEAAEFLQGMDNEGGLSSLLYYGTHVFPEELQGLATRTLMALEHLDKAVTDWAAARGVAK